jgi:hypothetical protein
MTWDELPLDVVDVDVEFDVDEVEVEGGLRRLRPPDVSLAPLA